MLEENEINDIVEKMKKQQEIDNEKGYLFRDDHRVIYTNSLEWVSKEDYAKADLILLVDYSGNPKENCKVIKCRYF